VSLETAIFSGTW